MRPNLLVVGSVAFDTVETPFGKAEEVLGGSACYFSMAASYFTKVCMVGVVGDDFPSYYLDVLKAHRVDIRGLKYERGETFRWSGQYGYDLNEAVTLETRLNVFREFRPELPEDYKDCEYVFLANIDPLLQGYVLDQMRNPKLVACDTMNYWIEGAPEELKRTLARVDMVVINDAETRELAKEPNILRAARKILDMGPKILIIKRGEYGAMMVSREGIFSTPGFPLEDVFDPTGAGDTFAGGLMGYLAGNGPFTEITLRQGIIFGCVMASFNVEDFSLRRLRDLSTEEIQERYKEFRRIIHFGDLSAQ